MRSVESSDLVKRAKRKKWIFMRSLSRFFFLGREIVCHRREAEREKDMQSFSKRKVTPSQVQYNVSDIFTSLLEFAESRKYSTKDR